MVKIRKNHNRQWLLSRAIKKWKRIKRRSDKRIKKLEIRAV